jgi:hypothetical protein
MRFDSFTPWLATVAGNQRPLGYHGSEDTTIKMPFDKAFDALVAKNMDDFKVPGLSIAVVSGPVTYAKVRQFVLDQT